MELLTLPAFTTLASPSSCTSKGTSSGRTFLGSYPEAPKRGTSAWHSMDVASAAVGRHHTEDRTEVCCWQLTSVRPVHLEQVQVICAQALQALLNTLLYLLRRDSGGCAWPEVLVLIISA